MGYQEHQVLELIRAKGPATILSIIDHLNVPAGSAWKLVERMEHKKLLMYDGELRAWREAFLTGSRMHRWDVPRGIHSFRNKWERKSK